ncbi:unnamed protein product [Musa acuminata var. zebrina]
MAARFGLAGGIPESWVRPIRDADDSRESKAAFKLATGLVAKYNTREGRGMEERRRRGDSPSPPHPSSSSLLLLSSLSPLLPYSPLTSSSSHSPPLLSLPLPPLPFSHPNHSPHNCIGRQGTILPSCPCSQKLLLRGHSCATSSWPWAVLAL